MRNLDKKFSETLGYRWAFERFYVQSGRNSSRKEKRFRFRRQKTKLRRIDEKFIWYFERSLTFLLYRSFSFFSQVPLPNTVDTINLIPF